MYPFLFIIVLLILTIFHLTGSTVLKLLKTNNKSMSLLIGYLFTVLVFQLFELFLFVKDFFPYYLLLIAIFAFLYPQHKNKNVDVFVLFVITIITVYYFTLGIDYDTTFLSSLRQYTDGINYANINPYQKWISALSDSFNLDITIFTVHVMTIVNLVVIFYTNFELCEVIFISKKKSRIAFLLFLVLFITSNTRNPLLYHPLNAYTFVFSPFSGTAVYLYAILVLQLAMFSKYSKKNNGIILLINLTCFAFTRVVVFTQLIFNFTVLFMFLYFRSIKSLKEFTNLFIYTLIPTVVYSYLYFIEDRIISVDIKTAFLIFITVITLIFLIITLIYIPNIHLYLSKTLFHLSYVLLLLILLTFFVYLIINKRIELSQFTFLRSEYYREKAQVLVFYFISLYSLYRLSKYKDLNKQMLFFFPLFLSLFFINPFFYGVTTAFSKVNFNYFLYLLPLGYGIIFVFWKSNPLVRFVMLLLLVMIPTTIFSGIPHINDTDKDFFYRVDKDVLSVAQHLSNDRVYSILSDDLVTREIGVLRSNVVLSEKNVTISEMISDKKPYDEDYFLDFIHKSEINTVIVNSNLYINQYLSNLTTTKNNVGYYTIYYLREVLE